MRTNEIANRVIDIEIDSLKEVKKNLNKNFEKAVNFILKTKGRVVVMGIGKSGLIGRKIAATFSSTGTPSFFLHPSEGMHGDLGMLKSGDTVIALSYSGKSDEVKKILPVLKKLGIKIIAFTGDKNSPLAKNSDIIINLRIKKEACPYNITPTSSTTAMLVVGDALAIALMRKRKITLEKLAKLHPGGNIGKKIALKAEDIMRKGKFNPVVTENITVKKALFVMTKTKLGATSIINKKGKLVGYFTDGDLRRYLQKGLNILKKPIKNVMTKKPFTIKEGTSAIEVAKIFKEKNFDNIPVVDRKNKPIGIIDERDLISEGLLD